MFCLFSSFYRNLTELTDVVTKAAFFFKNLFLLGPNNSSTLLGTLEDYTDCGIRNNDTFRSSSSYSSSFGNESTADWSVECLWDCAWKDNPYVGRTYLFNDTIPVNITLSMPKIPVDLSCLNGCTDTSPPTYFDSFSGKPLDCSSSTFKSFFGCYIYFSQFIGTGLFKDNGTFVSKNYFHMAVESCILAILEPTVYNYSTCTSQGVNLRVFNPYLKNSSSLSNSLPNFPKSYGPASQEVVEFVGILGGQLPAKNRHPWQCSLQTRIPGYRGAHRCGVTLLSAPPKPTIFVSAAHCNYLCKDSIGRVVEICCCREPKSIFSCITNDFCGQNSTLQLATSQDLQIVCNTRTLEFLPDGAGYPNVTILRIKEIRNHPNYLPLNKEYQNGGPIDGYDVSVYFVDDGSFADRLNKSSIWPACLPQAEKSYLPGNRGILVGWNEPKPTYLYNLYDANKFASTNELQDYNNEHLVAHEALFVGQVSCSDPKWMRSSSYYPPGTVCYTEASWAGSVQFGMSGSGLVRPFTYSYENGTTTTRYSWAGPLSMSKGSDRTVLSDYSGFIEYSSNPAVFTDARCYLDWIAAQYSLSLPAGYQKPASCAIATGDRAAVNNTNCLSRAIRYNETSNTPQKCYFTSTFDRCYRYAYNFAAKPAYNLNFYFCGDVKGHAAICANDCPGVDPNAVVIGGEAALFSLAVASSIVPDLLGPALGAGVGLAGLGLGGVSMTRTRSGSGPCPGGQCRAQQSRQCCGILVMNGRQVCPLAC